MLASLRGETMSKNTLTRRAILRDAVHLAVIGTAPFLVQGCKKEPLVCSDASGLKPNDAELRSALEYQDASPHGETKNCSNCAFYVAGPKNECGQCTLVKGPIHPLGYCSSWAMKG